MAFELHILLPQPKTLPTGHTDLLLHDVETRDQLGDGVLHLNPGVHLNEIELSVLVEEFNGASAAIADLLAGLGTPSPDLVAQLLGELGRRGLFEHLLMAALHGAVALAEVDHVAMVIGHDLNFDVPRILEELLHVDLGIVECGGRLRLGGVHSMDEGRLGVHHPHAAPAAAAGRLDDDGVANGPGTTNNLFGVVWQGAFRARHAWHTSGNHGPLGCNLVAHHANDIRRGPNEGESASFHPLGKVGILREKAVAGVDGLCIRDLGRRNDGRNVQVALAGGGRADADRFVGKPDVLGLGVGGGMHHHRLDAELPAGTLDSEGDLPPIGDEHFLE